MKKGRMQERVKKTDESATETVETKQAIVASFTSSGKKQMYKEGQPQNSPSSYNNLLLFNPQMVSHSVSKQVYMLSDGQSYVVMGDGFYALMGNKANTHLISRRPQPHGEFIGGGARMPGAYIYLWSLEAYSDYVHMNSCKYNPLNAQLETYDVHVPASWGQFLGFVTVENGKKGVYVTKVSSSQWRVSYLPLGQNNRVKRTEEVHGEKLEEMVVEEPQHTQQILDVQGSERFIKIINSEYGDMVLVVTNHCVYEIQLQPTAFNIKTIDLLHKLDKYLQESNKYPLVEGKDELVDLNYVLDGLRLIYATKKGFLGMFENSHIRSTIQLQQLIGEGVSACELGLFNKKLMVRLSDNSLVLLRMEGQLVLDRMVELEIGKDVMQWTWTPVPKTEEILLQQHHKDHHPRLEVLKKSILSSQEFSTLYQTFYQSPKHHPPTTLLRGKANTVACMISGDELSFHRLIDNLYDNPTIMRHQFSTSFYEKPLCVGMDPYASTVVVLFRESIKFYKLEYNCLEEYFNLNIRNVTYVGYSQQGQYLMVGKDDGLYLLNAFTLETERVIEVLGDVRSVHFHDVRVLVQLRNKTIKGSTLVVLDEEDGEYVRKDEMIVGQKQVYTCSQNKIIICRKDSIEVHMVEDKKRSYGAKVISLALGEYPTCVYLLESLGFLVVGTNQGNIYQYLWPFTHQPDLPSYSLQVSTQPIISIVPSISFHKLNVFFANGAAVQLHIIQYINGKRMSSIYEITSKSLYTNQHKHQFVNNQYLYANHTTFINSKMEEFNEDIDQFQFINEKIKDDLDEYRVKKTQSNQNQFINYQKKIEGQKENAEKQSLNYEKQSQTKNENLAKQFQEMNDMYNGVKEENINKYQKKLLDLYKESDRLKGIYQKQEQKLTKEKDVFILRNAQVKSQFRKEEEETIKSLEHRCGKLIESFQMFQRLTSLEKKEGQIELEQFKNMMKNKILAEYDQQEARKQALLGLINYHQNEIQNYRKRKNEFEALNMQTRLQIQDLKEDQKQYESKKSYLSKELQEKEDVIQQKEKELVFYIRNTALMKKAKNTHEFEMNQYRKQIEPIQRKLQSLDQEVRQMNEEIMKEYQSKKNNQVKIEWNLTQEKRLKRIREQRIKNKLDSATTLKRFIEQLSFLLQNPMDSKIRHRLYQLVIGEKYEINEEEIMYKNKNKQIIRKKAFMSKKIEEQEKYDKHLMKNQNQFLKYYNENEILLKQFQDLKQQHKQLREKKNELEQKLKVHRVVTPSDQVRTPKKRTTSLLQLKKHSEKMFTPFQKHQRQYNEMFNKKTTIQTKMSGSKGGKSQSFLKSLMKEVQGSDSRYEKMQIIRERVRTFVNPELTGKKGLRTQRLIFDAGRALPEV